jgi:DNA-binding transcriptional ArsR family regulator
MEDKSKVFRNAVSRGQKGEISNFKGWLKKNNISHQRFDSLSEGLKQGFEVTVNRDREIEVLGEYVGYLQQQKGQKHVAIEGVSGVGKTHLVSTVKDLIEDIEGQFRFEYLKAEEMKDEAQFSSKLSRLKEDSENSSIVVYDNLDKEKRISFLLEKFKDIENILLITLWNPENLRMKEEEIDEEFPVSDIISVDPLTRDETQKLVEVVAEEISEVNTKKSDISSFSSSIYRYSKGVPGVAIEIFQDSIRRSFHVDDRNIYNKKSVVEVAKRKNIEDLEEKLRNLSDVKNHIIEKVLVSQDQRGISPSKLSKDLKKDKSTISYHLKDLKREGIIQKDSYGRQTYYAPASAVKPFLQIHIQEESQFYE